MRRAAQSDPIREKSGPVFARAQVPAAPETFAPEVFGPFFAMRIMRVAPHPRSQRAMMLARRRDAREPLILFLLFLEEASERRIGQFPGIERMIGPDLRIANPRHARQTAQKQNLKYLS